MGALFTPLTICVRSQFTAPCAGGAVVRKQEGTAAALESGAARFGSGAGGCRETAGPLPTLLARMSYVPGARVTEVCPKNTHLQTRAPSNHTFHTLPIPYPTHPIPYHPIPYPAHRWRPETADGGVGLAHPVGRAHLRWKVVV